MNMDKMIVSDITFEHFEDGTLAGIKTTSECDTCGTKIKNFFINVELLDDRADEYIDDNYDDLLDDETDSDYADLLDDCVCLRLFDPDNEGCLNCVDYMSCLHECE